MALTWPDGLPYAQQRNGYKLANLGLPAMKSPMQSGRTRMRRQYTLRVSTMQVSIVLTAAQLGVFHGFVAQTGQATAAFTMPVWIASRSAYEPRTVQIRDGAEGIAESEFAFGMTQVSFVLDIQNL